MPSMTRREFAGLSVFAAAAVAAPRLAAQQEETLESAYVADLVVETESPPEAGARQGENWSYQFGGRNEKILLSRGKLSVRAAIGLSSDLMAQGHHRLQPASSSRSCLSSRSSLTSSAVYCFRRR
jgi:hypothetical protein